MSRNAKKNSEYLKPTMFDLKLINFMFSLFVNCIDPFKIVRNYIVKPATEKFLTVYEQYKEKTSRTFDSSQSIILRLFVILSIGFLLLCGAILIYILFYLMYMPSPRHVKVVNMQYNKICDEANCDLQTMISPYHTFPIAHLQLNKNQLMMVGQPYYINIRLELPETPRNLDLGVFMVCVDMKDKENLLKSHACRSTMLRYRSPVLRLVRTVIYLPFYVLGLREEKQKVDVEMFANYVDTMNPVTDIYVEIQSKVIEFYGVSIHILAHFTGLRYIIFHFPIISACIGIAINFIVLVIIALVLWCHYDYEMEWVDEAKRKITGKSSGKSKKDYSRQGSSSISVDENLSIMEYSDSDKLEIEDDDLLFDPYYDDVKLKSHTEE